MAEWADCPPGKDFGLVLDFGLTLPTLWRSGPRVLPAGTCESTPYRLRGHSLSPYAGGLRVTLVSTPRS